MLAVLLQELRASGAVRLNHKKLNKLLGFCERHGNTAVGLDFLKVGRRARAKHSFWLVAVDGGGLYRHLA